MRSSRRLALRGARRRSLGNMVIWGPIGHDDSDVRIVKPGPSCFQPPSSAAGTRRRNRGTQSHRQWWNRRT